MWTSLPTDSNLSTASPLHRSAWLSGATTWQAQVNHAEHVIEIGGKDRSLMLAVQPVGVDRLPAVEEEYVRGDEWHLWMPQQPEDIISLKLSLRTIHCDEVRWIVEATFAIQTLLLDTHPTLDLSVMGNVVPSAPVTQGCSPITCVETAPEGSIAILLGPTDAPYTTNKSNSQEARLRLFGEFLEKGVIRKARPWIVFDRNPGDCDPTELNALLDQLRQTPPPLTP